MIISGVTRKTYRSTCTCKKRGVAKVHIKRCEPIFEIIKQFHDEDTTIWDGLLKSYRLYKVYKFTSAVPLEFTEVCVDCWENLMTITYKSGNEMETRLSNFNSKNISFSFE